MTRIPLPALLRYHRGSLFRGDVNAREILAREWARVDQQRARWRQAINEAPTERIARPTAAA